MGKRREREREGEDNSKQRLVGRIQGQMLIQQRGITPQKKKKTACIKEYVVYIAMKSALIEQPLLMQQQFKQELTSNATFL